MGGACLAPFGFPHRVLQDAMRKGMLDSRGFYCGNMPDQAKVCWRMRRICIDPLFGTISR